MPAQHYAKSRYSPVPHHRTRKPKKDGGGLVPDRAPYLPRPWGCRHRALMSLGLCQETLFRNEKTRPEIWLRLVQCRRYNCLLAVSSPSAPSSSSYHLRSSTRPPDLSSL